MASIRQRSQSSWQITVSCGYDSKGKKIIKQKTVRKPGNMTDKQWEKELQRIAAKFEDEILKGTYFEPEKFTFSEFVKLWFEKQVGNLSPKTLWRYKQLLQPCLEAFGHLKLEQIKPLHCLNLYDNLRKTGISNRTVLHHHRLLHLLFNYAIKWGMLKENVCANIQPVKIQKQEMKSLNEEELQKLIEALNNEPLKYKTMIILAIVTGCRRGELCALQWKHINFENSTIHIKQSAIYTPETGIIVKEPKTLSSIRKIAIPKFAVDVLKEYKKWQNEQKLKLGDMWLKEEREKCGDIYEDPQWVFTTWNGGIIHPDTISKVFKEIIRKYNLPDIRFHDLRHTAATMLLQAGLNVRAVASRLGHANPNMTLSVYAHALQSADKQAADIMDNIISSKTK